MRVLHNLVSQVLEQACKLHHSSNLRPLVDLVLGQHNNLSL